MKSRKWDRRRRFQRDAMVVRRARREGWGWEPRRFPPAHELQSMSADVPEVRVPLLGVLVVGLPLADQVMIYDRDDVYIVANWPKEWPRLSLADQIEIVSTVRRP